MVSFTMKEGNKYLHLTVCETFILAFYVLKLMLDNAVRFIEALNASTD